MGQDDVRHVKTQDVLLQSVLQVLQEPRERDERKREKGREGVTKKVKYSEKIELGIETERDIESSGAKLPAIHDLYTRQCRRKAPKNGQRLQPPKS